MKKQLFALGIIFVAGSAYAVAQGAIGPVGPTPEVVVPALETPVPVVRTVVLRSAPDTLSRQFFGQVRARETVDLSFEVGGTLHRLIPEEGTRVAAGQMIAQLRTDAFERAVARAELQFEMAAREAERAGQLAARAVGPGTRAEDAATARDMAEVALRDARAALTDATLTAPFDGLVAVRIASEYSSVAPGQPVLRLHDLSQVRIEIAVPERLIAAAGGLGDVRFDARLASGRDVPLSLVAFQPETDRVGQSYRVTLALNAADGAGLLPGASVTVTVTLPAPDVGMTVPATALLARNDRQAEVFVMQGGSTVHRVPVTVTAPTGNGFRIEGLPEGAEVVAMGAHRLRDGQAVRRFAPQTYSEN